MPIHTDAHGWVLETSATGYAFGLNQAGLLVHRYWGAKLNGPADYPLAVNPKEWSSFNSPAQLTSEEYPGYEDAKYIDPCVKVTFADGVRNCVLRFAEANILGGATPELRITLRDTFYPLQATLIYRVHEQYDLIERAVEFVNQSTEPIKLERAFSAQWHLPRGDTYRLTHVVGKHMNEMNLRQKTLSEGLTSLESRRITTSHHANPWFALDRGAADEDHGEVWFGVLAWSGNWKMVAEVTDFAATRISLGLNDWDFSWRLAGGAQFATPSSFAGYTQSGFGGASRLLHRYIREQIVPHGRSNHEVLYNSWEATLFDVDEESQIKLAEIAASIGVELFVMDDGWFHGRNHDRAGLGDWWPDEAKFPNGLGHLIERVNGLGMNFGLWIEPEMVNPDSELYRKHPDWVLHYPNRERTTARNQLILNMARSDVQAYLIEQLDRLLTENNIAFIKWDMNRNASEVGWPDAPGEQQEIWVRYVQGLYHVWGTLRERHPHVIWQSCSGGGGRADLAILRLTDQIWASDNTEPTARLNIQEGFSQIFPPDTMEAWVTEMGSRHLSLAFRFHVSMCGVLGIGSHLLHWSAEERTEAAHWVARYKELRPIIQHGALYRLRSPQREAFSALMYVGEGQSEAVLFAFRTHLPPPTILPPIYLRGLDPQALYEIEGIEGGRSGAAWMHAGVQIELGDFESTVRKITRRS
jgi:alpha-galactosidase